MYCARARYLRRKGRRRERRYTGARTTLRHTKQRTEFSCWRYREVPIRVLQEDLDDVERFINGENVHPLFLRQNRKLLPINNA